MSHPSVEDVDRLVTRSFDELPTNLRRRLLGVDYAVLDLAGGGRMFVTRFGWPWLAHLLPQHWYDGQQFARRGLKLGWSTGHVYRVRSAFDDGRGIELVIKISRLAQDVPLLVIQGAVTPVSEADLSQAGFNNPFEEFALVQALRDSPVGPGRPRIRTKRPLMIYSPPERYALWQTGRRRHRFLTEQVHLQQRGPSPAADSGPADGFPVLDIEREYVLTYAWLKGYNAEELVDLGLLTETDLGRLAAQVSHDLATHGFVVLDHKPNHVILRQRRDGSLLTRAGRWACALADFELLKRVPPAAD